MSEEDITPMLQAARMASRQLNTMSDGRRAVLIADVADMLELSIPEILEANKKDLARMDASDPKYDRLALSADRIKAIAADTRHVATLPSPLGELERRVLPNGLVLRKEAVPFGVIGVIYEARPNVSADVFSLCFKVGNAVVLKGGHDAAASNAAIVNVIHAVLEKHGISTAAATLLPSTREATAQLLQARGLVDLLIPRGSRQLIDRVRRDARIPVIETGAGVCHTFIDKTADVSMAAAIVNNGKTRRVSVCNALDCLLVHHARLGDLPAIVAALAQAEVVIWADKAAFEALAGHYPADLLRPATERHFGTEFLDYAMSVKTVRTVEDAIEHINIYGSGHSEAIVTADEHSAMLFQRDVDAACVYVNAPTSFTDGAQFGLGAEIGISTQKLHARGPMALREITTYKWLINGNGQIRPK
ncbi:MAG: glutamate-5-semialdehyde dehydrogenase [Muribaculaceae bacterium]|nr:glutamate-5-semialdehyde dehydrogenase [Muribaculaceae bacterium]